ncbi:MAG: 5-(carboxyamino)imidazole ribonucleotide synthase [Bacteroidales bacterium]
MTRRIGIIGGGQLGLMIAQEAHRLGAFVSALDPSPDAPAFAETDSCIVAEYDDLKALEALGDSTDVLTYEFENVPGDILRHLEGKYDIKQGIAPLFDSQDRLREKNNARRHGLPTPDYIAVPECSADEDCALVPVILTDEQRIEELTKAVGRIGFPCVLKTRRLGYDGHGQEVIKNADDIPAASALLKVPCVLEGFVDFDYESSVIMVRDGENIIHFPIGRNFHKGGILDLSVVPAEGMYEGENESDTGRKITAACEKFMTECGYLGILAIELFVKGDEFVFNEMAPRPHNSGHYTIEGCTTNQYRELVRFLLGEPLNKPHLIAPTVMKNILGQDLEAAREISGKGVFVHIYGKTESRPKRKMGHITFVPCTLEQYRENWAGKFIYGNDY